MIKKLKKIFPSLIINSDDDHLYEHYKWFITSKHEIIGIPHGEISQKELSLLNTFLTPYHIKLPTLSPKEKEWRDIVQQSTNTLEINGFFRFVYFSIQDQIDPLAFKEAIEELFSNHVPILWKNEHEGILIEECDKKQEAITYKQIIDILMSDLYGKINFFIGPFKDNITNVRQYYLSIIKDAQIAFNYSKKPVITYIEAIPFLLMDQLDSDFKTSLSELVLQEFSDDNETLKMIETFVECNLNISETAKELYMHRNSLQYRLDRFQKKTGIDIRLFHEAMTVYLALLANKK